MSSSQKGETAAVTSTSLSSCGSTTLEEEFIRLEFQVPYDDEGAKALLHQKGFNPGDVREVAVEVEYLFPMVYFSKEGDLMMCQWLHANGAEEDISRADNDGRTPMLWACVEGHLSICEWLFEVGADRDISRADNFDQSPMLVAGYIGHLSVCKWLFEVGADGDISRADNDGETPMYRACGGGHLSVCKWLFEVGADRDIFRMVDNGRSPMYRACSEGHLSVCEWLVLKGALIDPDSAGQHISQAIVERDVVASYSGGKIRSQLLAWAQGVVAASDSFRKSFLMGTYSRSSPNIAATAAAAAAAASAVTALSPLSKLSGLTDALELVAEFLDVRRGRELRNAREFAECLDDG